MRLILLLAACLAIASAQSPTFDVASVKLTHQPSLPSFPLDSGNAKPPGGRFSASFSLSAYIMFAYKLEVYQANAVNAKLPKWATTDMYEIQAKAEGNPTKDQMRLMMQSLLEDRFKLKVHFETQEMPVFALTLVKPGQMGPKLISHDQGPPCPDSYTWPKLGDLPTSDEVFPPMCEYSMMSFKSSGIALVGARNSTPEYLATAISSSGMFAGEVDKPVVDRTGLSGRFDFTIEYAPDPARAIHFGPGPPKLDAPAGDLPGPTFLEAVRKQLGLKLVPDKGPVQILVVDHVEKPSEN